MWIFLDNFHSNCEGPSKSTKPTSTGELVVISPPCVDLTTSPATLCAAPTSSTASCSTTAPSYVSPVWPGLEDASSVVQPAEVGHPPPATSSSNIRLDSETIR